MIDQSDYVALGRLRCSLFLPSDTTHHTQSLPTQSAATHRRPLSPSDLAAAAGHGLRPLPSPPLPLIRSEDKTRGRGIERAGGPRLDPPPAGSIPTVFRFVPHPSGDLSPPPHPSPSLPDRPWLAGLPRGRVVAVRAPLSPDARRRLPTLADYIDQSRGSSSSSATRWQQPPSSGVRAGFHRAEPVIIDPGHYADMFWTPQRRSVTTAFKLFTGFHMAKPVIIDPGSTWTCSGYHSAGAFEQPSRSSPVFVRRSRSSSTRGSTRTCSGNHSAGACLQPSSSSPVISKKQHKLITAGAAVLNLGCTPDTWLQVACQNLGRHPCLELKAKIPSAHCGSPVRTVSVNVMALLKQQTQAM